MPTEGRVFGHDLEVSFERLKQSLEKRGRSRLLWQFRNSPVLNQLIKEMSAQMQDAYDAAIDTLEKRTIAKATGVNLEILGTIVGQERVGNNLEYHAYFHPDKPGWSADQAPAWVTGVPLLGYRVASDDSYRKLILAKIFKNHCLAGSAAENRYCAEFIANTHVSFVKIGLQSFRLAFEFGTGMDVMLMLFKLWKNQTIDQFYLLPIPATVYLDDQVTFVLPMEDGYSVGFGPDMYDTRPDFAKAAICINIGDYV